MRSKLFISIAALLVAVSINTFPSVRSYGATPTLQTTVIGTIMANSSSGTELFALAGDSTNSSIDGESGATGSIAYNNSSNVFSGSISVSAIGLTLTGSGDEIIASGSAGSGYLVSSGGTSGTFSGTININADVVLSVSPSCSNGSLPQSGVCPSGKALVCPSGYSINGSSCDEVVDNVYALVGSGSNVNITGTGGSGDIGFTVQYVCPSGYLYDSSTGQCNGIPQSGTSSTYECTDYNGNFQNCLSGVSFSGTTDTCSNNTQPATCQSGYTLDTTTGACTATITQTQAPICPTGTAYNSADGQCETPVTATCPSGTTYLTNGICGAQASCPSGTSINTSGQCVQSGTITSTTCPNGTTYNSANNDCEVAGTVTCPSGTTLSGTTCTATATCPTGTTYNSTNNDCEGTSTITCPNSSYFTYVYNSSTNECVDSQVLLPAPDLTGTLTITGSWAQNNETIYLGPTIEYSGTYSSPYYSFLAPPNTIGQITDNNGATDGFFGTFNYYLGPNYDPSQQIYFSFMNRFVSNMESNTAYNLILDNISTSGVDSCLNPASDVYPKEFTAVGGNSIHVYNNLGNLCFVATFSPYNSSYDYGTVTATPTGSCPSGTTWNSTENACSAALSCPSGTTYNSTSNDCSGSATLTCPSGTTWNSTENACSAALSCPSGTTAISGTQCQGSSTTTQSGCPSGTTWNPQYVECAVSGSQNACPTGTAVSGDMCVASATCPSGYTLDASNGLCTETITSTEPPSCPSGYSYSGGGTCSQSASSNSGTSAELCPFQETPCDAGDTTPTCPGTGYTYNSSTQQCEKTTTATTSPTCASGATLDASTGMCVLSSGPTCPGGTTINGSYCDYTGNVMCPWNTSGNVEVYPTNDSSGGVNGAIYGYSINWNQTSNECYYPDSNPSIVELYELAVQRLPDANGYDYWYSQWGPGQPTLSEVETWVTSAQGSYASGADPAAVCSSTGIPYYPPSNTNAMNIIAYFLYYLGRCPESSGYQYYLTNGYSSSNFLNSPECATDASNGTPCPTLGDVNMCTSNYSYNSSTTDCESTPTVDCFDGGTQVSGTTDTCQMQPFCPGGYSLNSSGQCVGSPTTCSSGSLQGGQCTSSTTQTECPTCPTGSNLQNGQCVGEVCPLGGPPQGSSPGQNYACVEPSGSSTYYCSPDVCYNNVTNAPPPAVNYPNQPPQSNDGTTTSSKPCSGTIYIFSGQEEQCQPSGADVIDADCCSFNQYNTSGKSLSSTSKCTTDNEYVTATNLNYDEQYGWPTYDSGGNIPDVPANVYGSSYYVGKYCNWSWPIVGGCGQSTNVYCNFSSPLALLIQVYGRQQLGLSWGTPQSPECNDHFTIQEFQELNISAMNLTSYETLMEREFGSTINNGIATGTNALSNSVSQGATSMTNQVNQYYRGTIGSGLTGTSK